jgi:hypothetical protein
VLAYRSQYHIENAFRQMKNPHFLGWSPMYHWTDSKIQVHGVMAIETRFGGASMGGSQSYEHTATMLPTGEVPSTASWRSC